MKVRSLQEWLSDHADVDGLDCVISSISSDSRTLEPGAAFLAYPGYNNDGRQFIQEAIDRGAAAIIYEPPLTNAVALSKTGVPLIPVLQLSQCRGILAARFYETPSSKMTTIGITGTNGKTSCADFIAQALAMRDMPCGVVGTLGVGVWPDLTATGMTTVDAVQLQQCFFELVCSGAKHTVMEVSSHGLSLGRLNATELDIAVFTQLSRDHLDFHGSMTAYQQAKMSLFQQPGLRSAVVNVDDACGQQIVKQHSHRLAMVGVSLQQKTFSIPMVVAKQVLALTGGFELQVATPWGEGVVFVPLLGKFNVYNALLVMGVLGSLGWNWEQLVAALSALQPVRGRMQCLGGDNQPTVVVDYAHTPDALEQVLMSLKAHCDGQLWCVFGCGGGRDSGKRPLMAQVAEQYSDHVIVTNDNPRGELPQSIADEIHKGFSSPATVATILNREQAIATAVKSAGPYDVVLVAGKGHETVQVVGDHAFPFCDVTVVKEQLMGREQHV